jgi:hypothetical protein
MNARPGPLAVDPGLLARFRAAGAKIAWRPTRSKARRAGGGGPRVAHLNDEEARVVTSASGGNVRVAVDSGPLGALVLLLEIDRRGPPTALGASEAGHEPGFSSGAIVAAWGEETVPTDSRPRVTDLVELARYALA